MRFLLAGFLLMPLIQAKLQNVIVKGQLLCGTQPYAGADTRLVDEDTFFDDLMSSMKTKKDGKFFLNGSTDEYTTIDPVLKIYHNCNDVKDGVEVKCDRRWVFPLPSNIIQAPDTKTPIVFDIGIYNLEIIPKGETHDCKH